jgi:Pilus formation protein N terminal region
MKVLSNPILTRKITGSQRLGRLILSVLFLAMLTPAQAAEKLDVFLDQAKLLKLPAGAETIVIGNPAIADVAVQKNGIMVLTGRSSGQTNLIALDKTGTIISETIIVVANNQAGKLLVQRGLESNSYDCGLNRCQPGIALGDENGFFGTAIGQATQRDGMANSNPQPEKK